MRTIHDIRRAGFYAVCAGFFLLLLPGWAVSAARDAGAVVPPASIGGTGSFSVLAILERDGSLVSGSEDGEGRDTPVTGKTWHWMETRYPNDATASPARPETYTVRFRENGGIEIKADCNLKNGTYSLKGKELSIRIRMSTMAMCVPGSQEERFTRDLASGAILFLKDGDLYIDLKYDGGTMRFSGKIR